MAGPAGLGRQQGGRAPGLLQEELGLFDFGLGHDPAVDDADPVLLRRELGGRRDAPGDGGTVLRNGRLLSGLERGRSQNDREEAADENHFHPI